MKKIANILLLLLFLSSCNNDDDAKLVETQLVSGKWNLTKVTNTSTGDVILPDGNSTHFYQINDDGTFIRVASKDSIPDELLGSYLVSDTSRLYGNEDNSIIKFIELTYTTESTFFNCNLLDSNKQLLILTSDNVLYNTLEGVCDGANFEYRKETN